MTDRMYIKLAYPQSGGNETPKKTSICFKNGRNLYVDNRSLCDEIKSKKKHENNLHQTSKSPHK